MPDEEREEEEIEVENEDTGDGEGGTESISKEEFDEAQSKKDEEIEKLNKELEVQKEKDRNFKKINTKANKAEEEKSELAQRIEALEEERTSNAEEAAKAAIAKKEALIEGASKGDENLKGKIEFFYNRFSDDIDPEERAKLAVSLAENSGVNDVNNDINAATAINGGSSSVQGEEPEDYSHSDNGKQLAKDLSLNFIKPKKQ